MQTTILTAADVREIVHRIGLDELMDETISHLTDAFQAFDSDKIVVPTRAGFCYDSPAMGLIEWMPCMRSGDSAHIKVVGYHPANGECHDLPTILSTLSMYGVHDGHLRGVMDGTFITAVRTGAASAVASRILARPGSTSLGMIGCGSQAITQLHALSRVFPLRQVFFHDTDADAMASFTDRIACLHLDGIELQARRPDEFLGAVDILCTATSVGVGEGPVFAAAAVQPHIHINAIGSDFPGKTELPANVLLNSLVCPDFADQAMKEGECQALDAGQVGPDVHTLVKSQERYQAARERQTVFDSTGWAVEDMVCMDMFMGYAQTFGIGHSLALESISSDCLNPYQFLFDATGEQPRAVGAGALKRAI